MIKNLLPKNKTVVSCCAVIVCMFAASACKKDQPPAPASPSPQNAKAAPVQAKPIQKPVSSALALRPSAVNQFDFSNKKDPFKAFIALKATPASNAESIKKSLRNSLPIHSFDVGQFKLIGIVIGGRESQAMVTDPNGKGYVLRVGMTIGKNDGKITAITSGGVNVLEQFRDDNGRVRRDNIKLTLPRKQ